MNWQREVEPSASAGINSVILDMPRKSTIRVINAHNATTFWKPASIRIIDTRTQYPNIDTYPLGLVFKASQVGERDVKWRGVHKVSGNRRRVEAIFYDCTLADLLTLTVGYDD